MANKSDILPWRLQLPTVKNIMFHQIKLNILFVNVLGIPTLEKANSRYSLKTFICIHPLSNGQKIYNANIN